MNYIVTDLVFFLSPNIWGPHGHDTPNIQQNFLKTFGKDTAIIRQTYCKYFAKHWPDKEVSADILTVIAA